jgi:hypothetical protein
MKNMNSFQIKIKKQQDSIKKASSEMLDSIAKIKPR